MAVVFHGLGFILAAAIVIAIDATGLWIGKHHPATGTGTPPDSVPDAVVDEETRAFNERLIKLVEAN